MKMKIFREKNENENFKEKMKMKIFREKMKIFSVHFSLYFHGFEIFMKTKRKWR